MSYDFNVYYAEVVKIVHGVSAQMLVVLASVRPQKYPNRKLKVKPEKRGS